MTTAALLAAQTTWPGPAAAQSCDLPVAGVRAQQSVASVPLIADVMNQRARLRSYTVPIQLAVTIHKFIFTFHVHHVGEIRYEPPDHITASVVGVSAKDTHVFSLLGTPQLWPAMYTLTLLGSDVEQGRRTYHLRGVPNAPSDVDHVLIDTTDPCAPIHATWVLNSGWTLTSAIRAGAVNGVLVPTSETTDIVGHGYHIHTVMTYGPYAMHFTPQSRAG